MPIACTNKKLSYRRGTARCVVSVEILLTATQQCRNDLYFITSISSGLVQCSSPKEIEVMKLEGYSGPMCNKHVHSTMTRSSRFQCPIGVINKPSTDVLIIIIIKRQLISRRNMPRDITRARYTNQYKEEVLCNMQ